MAAVPAAQAAPQLGAYLNNPNGGDSSAEALFEQSYASFVQTLGKAPTLIDNYVDYFQTVWNWPQSASWQAWSNSKSSIAKKMVPVIGFPMTSVAQGSMSSDQQFQAFASGQYDWAIQGVVKAWVQAGFKTMIVRVGWEMNVQGASYAGDSAQSQADWVRAFQHISSVLRQTASTAGAKLQVVWNPTATNYSNAEATNNLYPGDGYVDIIAADIYGGVWPFYDGSNGQIHDWVTGGEDYSVSAFIVAPGNRDHYWSYPAATVWAQDSSNGHSQSLSSLITFARQHNKPFGIAETGAGSSNAGNDVIDDASFPRWLGGMLTSAQQAGSTIAFVIIWDANADGNYQFSLPSDKKPYEAASWHDNIASFVGK